ncbi:MAG: YqgE/AlgH family protein [Fibrobacterota bacterium]
MKIKKSELSKGSLLLASPSLSDPNFQRSVILMGDYGPEGAFGFVLNKPSGKKFGELETNNIANPVFKSKAAGIPIFNGGPCEPEYLQAVHSFEGIKNSLKISEGLFIGGNFSEILSSVSGATASDPLKFFTGYAGWGPGQLDNEIKQKSWFVLPPEKGPVFRPSGKELWRDVLKSPGDPYMSFIADMPEDPGMN